VSPSPAAIGTVEVDDYLLEVGDPAGTALKRNREPTPAAAGSRSELSEALEEGEGERGRTPTEAGAELVDRASAETAKVERAVAIGKGLAQGEALDPAQLGIELDAVLGLLERLDRDGRWKEALRLARALSSLYSLLRRWAALLQSLRSALRAGEALGDQRAIGWAKHELGSLKLAADDVGGAAQDLGEAREIRERVGSRREIAVTERNLRMLCERLHGPTRDWRHRILRVSAPLALLAALLLLAGGIAGGVVGDQVVAGGDGDHGSAEGNGRNGKLLTVNLDGEGTGTVRSDPAGIDCGDDCEGRFAKGEKVTLRAEEGEDSTFKEFSGACEGDSPCTLKMTARLSVTATFALASTPTPTHTLSVTIQGAGGVIGGVADGKTSIECHAGGEGGNYGSNALPRGRTNTCHADFSAGSVVELTVAPDEGWGVASAKGCDPDSLCSVTMDAPKEVTVIFAQAPS
jgi:hypothetical protein